MTIRSDIQALPSLLAGEQLTCAEIAEQIGSSVVACRSTVANMAREGVLVGQRTAGTTRLYTLATEKPNSTVSVRQLNALWRPSQVPEELRHDAHY